MHPNIATKSGQHKRNLVNNRYFSDKRLYEPCYFSKNRKNTNRMNILLIQIDSLSFNHFRRMFPDTFELLSKSLKNNKIFDNFMVVGENTKSNTFPLLGNVVPDGVSELGIESEDQYYNKDYSSNFPFIWNDFQDLGYITMYNEDFLVNG